MHESTRASSSMASTSVRKSAPWPAVLLGEREPEQPELAHLLDDVHRELRALVHLLGARADDLLGELADDAAELLLLGGEVEVHTARSLRRESGGGQLPA